MSDTDLTALLDELDAANARAKSATQRVDALANAIHWLVLGSNSLTSDGYMPDLATSTLLTDGPIAQKDAEMAASLYALRHGVMLAYAALRDDATKEVKQVARALAQNLDIHASDLARRSEMEVAKLVLYMRKRGVDM